MVPDPTLTTGESTKMLGSVVVERESTLERYACDSPTLGPAPSMNDWGASTGRTPDVVKNKATGGSGDSYPWSSFIRLLLIRAMI